MRINPRRLVSVGKIADIVLVGVAVTMLALSWPKRSEHAPSTPRPPEAPTNWRSEIPAGIRWGSPDAPLTIVEFMDFQCPYCAKWAARVDSLFAEYPKAVQVVMHHYPLASHAFAVPAAIAVECAVQQGMQKEFLQVVFKQQSSLGTRPWSEVAVDAAMPDIERFTQCVLLPVDSFPRIAYGRQLGERVGVRGTPTVWINGVVERPNLQRLREMVERLMRHAQ
jgi:protein-disulfide isomerase